MKRQKRKIKVVIFFVIADCIIEQKKEKDNSNANNGGNKGFSQFQQAWFTVDVWVLPGDIIDGDPKKGDKQ